MCFAEEHVQRKIECVISCKTFVKSRISLSTCSVDQTLGGTAFTYRLRDHLAKVFNDQKKSKMDVRTNPRAMAKLYKEASRVLKVLSANKECFAQIEGLFEEKDFKVGAGELVLFSGELRRFCQLVSSDRKCSEKLL